MLLIAVSTVSSCKKILLMYYFVSTQDYSSEEHMCCVYVPTNHLYIGDIFLVSSNDVIRPNISVREGIGMPILCFLFSVSYLYSVKYALNGFDFWYKQNIFFFTEIVVSGGMSMPQVLSILEREPNQLSRIRSTRSWDDFTFVTHFQSRCLFL